MAFNAGTIIGKAKLDTTKWESGLKGMVKGTAMMAAAVVAAASVAFISSIKKANEYQKELSNVNTLLDGMGINTQKLSRDLLSLDSALGNTTELTKGMYQAFSAGAGTAEEALQITVDSAKFAKAALTDTNTAVDVLTTAMNAYGKEVVTSTQASDIFFTTIKKGKITGEQLAGTIGQSIPLFASAGIKLEELASGMAAMTKQGVVASEATTQLNAIVNSFLKPSAELAGVLTELGFASGAAFLETEGLAGALELLEERTNGDASALAELLPNIRAMRGAMALTGTGGKEFASTLEEMESALGATDIAFEKQEKTFATFKNELSKTQIIVGNIGKLFVDKLAHGATTALEAFNKFLLSGDAGIKFAQVVSSIAGGFAALVTFIKPIADTLGGVLAKVFETIGTTLGKVNEKTGEGAGAWKLFSGAIQITVVFIKLLGSTVNTAIKIIGNMITQIVQSADLFGSFFQALVDPRKWGAVASKVKQLGDTFIELPKIMFDGLAESGGIILSEMSSFTEETNTLALKAQEKMVVTTKVVSEFITETWDEMTTGQQAVFSELVENMETAVLASKETTDSQKDDAKTWASTWSKATKDAFDDIMSFYENFDAVASATISGISDISAQYYTNENARLDIQDNAEKEALDSKLANNLLTKEEFDAQEAELENKQLVRRNTIAKKEFEANKAFQIANIWMDAASATAGWWQAATALGPLAGPIFAGVMTGATATMAVTQTALASKQQFVPAFEDGGTFRTSGNFGIARVDESGGELKRLPDGTMIVPNDLSRQIASAGGKSSGNVSININNPNVYDDRMLNKMTGEISKKLSRQMRSA